MFTHHSRLRALLLLCAALPLCAWAQTSGPARAGLAGWAPFGNTNVLAGVAGSASGPVERVWFEGGAPLVQLPDGEVYRFAEGSEWTFVESPSVPPRPPDSPVRIRRADMSSILAHPMARQTVFAIGRQVYRSDDSGAQWTGLTRYRDVSILGDTLVDLALNPLDPDDLLVASDLGVWRSRDAGLTWFHAGEGLPNFAASRILSFPEGTRGLRILLRDGRSLEWVPGSVYGWKLLDPASPLARESVPPAISRLGNRVSAWDAAAGRAYAGRDDGTLLASDDGGRTWREYAQPNLNVIRSLHVDPADDRVALAVAESDAGETILLRTLNGGSFWDNWTPAGMPPSWDAAAPAWEQGALFLADGSTLYRFPVDFRAMSVPAAGASFPVEGLPARAVDLRLDPSGTMLFAVAANRGVFSVDVPGMSATPMVRHAADLSRGPATPGALLSVYGQPFRRLRANGADAVLLGGSPGNAQVQLPYGLSSDRVELAIEGSDRTRSLALALRRAAPSVFLHPDGNPFVIHPENGLFMDENNPLAPGTRFQAMLTGLGAVTPDWPAGMAAPMENPPAVLATVEAFVNGLRVPVIRATLAPGYAGIYLVEMELPAVMNDGLAELRIVAGGVSSNPVAIHVAY